MRVWRGNVLLLCDGLRQLCTRLLFGVNILSSLYTLLEAGSGRRRGQLWGPASTILRTLGRNKEEICGGGGCGGGSVGRERASVVEWGGVYVREQE